VWTIWGHVTAVLNERQGRFGIVVKTGSHAIDLKIHAEVPPLTLIARGTQRITLFEVNVGEFVELAYTFEGDRLVAKMIYVRQQDVPRCVN
jgi:hypothetical protein